MSLWWDILATDFSIYLFFIWLYKVITPSLQLTHPQSFMMSSICKWAHDIIWRLLTFFSHVVSKIDIFRGIVSLEILVLGQHRIIVYIFLYKKWGEFKFQFSSFLTSKPADNPPPHKSNATPFLWPVQRWPSSVRRDIWDGRYKAKALNKNHPFLSALARGKFAAASIDSFFPPFLYLILPPSPLFFELSLFLSEQRHTSAQRGRASPRLSPISLKSFCLFLKADLSAVHFWAIKWDWKSHLSRGKGWLPDCHLFLDFTAIGVCRCDWILPLSLLFWAFRPTAGEVSWLSENCAMHSSN